MRSWANRFVDFLATKHGLANVLHSDAESFSRLHDYFLERLVPVCDQLLAAARSAGEIEADIGAYQLMRGIGNLCIGAGTDDRYEPRRLVDLLISGLGRASPTPSTARGRHGELPAGPGGSSHG